MDLPLKPSGTAKFWSISSADDMIILHPLVHSEFYKKIRLRLAGVDAPNYVEDPLSYEAHSLYNEVLNKLNNSQRIKVHLHKKVNKSYVGELFYMYDNEYISLNQELIGQGYVFNRK